MKTLGQLVKNARLERRYTLPIAAKITGVSRMTLYRIENDDVNVLPVKMLHHICTVYQIDFFQALYCSKIIISSADLSNIKKCCSYLTYKGQEINVDILFAMIDEYYPFD